MKIVTNQYKAVKKSYKNNIFFGLLHSFLFLGIVTVFLPELLIIFGPTTIYKKVKTLKVNRFYKALILFVSYIILGTLIYFLFIFIKSNIFPYIYSLFQKVLSLMGL
jgi:hypothetical protein